MSSRHNQGEKKGEGEQANYGQKKRKAATRAPRLKKKRLQPPEDLLLESKSKEDQGPKGGKMARQADSRHSASIRRAIKTATPKKHS